MNPITLFLVIVIAAPGALAVAMGRLTVGVALFALVNSMNPAAAVSLAASGAANPAGDKPGA